MSETWQCVMLHNEEGLEVEGEKIATMFCQLCDDGRSSTHLTLRSYSP
jgi:hypothetical protein